MWWKCVKGWRNVVKTLGFRNLAGCLCSWRPKIKDKRRRRSRGGRNQNFSLAASRSSLAGFSLSAPTWLTRRGKKTNWRVFLCLYLAALVFVLLLQCDATCWGLFEQRVTAANAQLSKAPRDQSQPDHCIGPVESTSRSCLMVRHKTSQAANQEPADWRTLSEWAGLEAEPSWVTARHKSSSGQQAGAHIHTHTLR